MEKFIYLKNFHLYCLIYNCRYDVGVVSGSLNDMSRTLNLTTVEKEVRLVFSV